jgi:hypothetical protein
MPTNKPLDEKSVRKIVKEELKNFYLTLIVPNFASKFDLKNLTTEVLEIKTTQNQMMNTLDEMYGLMKSIA